MNQLITVHLYLVLYDLCAHDSFFFIFVIKIIEVFVIITRDSWPIQYQVHLNCSFNTFRRYFKLKWKKFSHNFLLTKKKFLFIYLFGVIDRLFRTMFKFLIVKGYMSQNILPFLYNNVFGYNAYFDIHFQTLDYS